MWEPRPALSALTAYGILPLDRITDDCPRLGHPPPTHAHTQTHTYTQSDQQRLMKELACQTFRWTGPCDSLMGGLHRPNKDSSSCTLHSLCSLKSFIFPNKLFFYYSPHVVQRMEQSTVSLACNVGPWHDMFSLRVKKACITDDI